MQEKDSRSTPSGAFPVGPGGGSPDDTLKGILTLTKKRVLQQRKALNSANQDISRAVKIANELLKILEGYV